MRVAGLDGTPEACYNGVYALQIGMWTCGRPVYKQKAGVSGTKERYLFRATSGKWYISDKEDAVTGKPRGSVKTQSRDNDAAHTPDQITGGWQYSDHGWLDVSEVSFKHFGCWTCLLHNLELLAMHCTSICAVAW